MYITGAANTMDALINHRLVIQVDDQSIVPNMLWSV